MQFFSRSLAKRLQLVTIFGLSLISSVAYAADPLFSDARSSTDFNQVAKLGSAPQVQSLNVYQVNDEQLIANRSTLSLTLKPGLSVTAQRISATTANTGSLVWHGKLTKVNGRSKSTLSGTDSLQNHAVLINNNGLVTGSVRVAGKLYQIRPLANGQSAIMEVDESLFPEEHPGEFLNLPEIPVEPAQAGPTDQLAPGDAVIRLLVAYTPSAASASGDINGLIDLAIAETNIGYQNSGVDVEVELAVKTQVSYSESGSFSTDLARFRNTNDGIMDNIHSLRDQNAADVGLIIINQSSSCGLASGIGSNAATAFAAVHYSCATGYYSFAHEIGHLQSARHDPAADPTNSPYTFGHGYRAPNSAWRTIMAYNCSGGCSRINYWSNPDVNYSDGQAMGTSNRSDNARVLNLTSPSLAAYRGGTPPPSGDVTLENGTPVTGVSGSQSSEQFFVLDVPANAEDLSFQISGGTGDADLYVRFGSKPTTSSYDCRPYLGGNNETCNISNAQQGTYYVMIRGYSAYSGVTVTGSYTEGGNDPNALQNGTPKTGLSGAQNSEQFYTLQVPAGASGLSFQISGGSGDADMYVRFGSQPTTGTYDCRPYRNGNNETCNISNAQAGTYHVMLRGYRSFSGVSLVASYN